VSTPCVLFHEKETPLKNLALLGLGLVLMVGVSGCGSPTHESITKDTIAAMNQLADALEKKDVNAVKAAINKLKDLKKASKGLKDPTDEEKKKLGEKYGPEILAAMMKAGKAQMAVGDNEEIKNAMKEFEEVMKEK
jgi:hypothetical protein